MTSAAGRNLAAHLARLARPLPAVHGADVSRDRGAGGWSSGGAARVDLETVVARAAAAGQPAAAREALAAAWGTLSPRDRRQIAAPLRPAADGRLRLGAMAAVQTSPTTCGSTVLVLLAAAGDPVLAAWLVTGRRLGHLPADLAGAVAGSADGGPTDRFAAAQEAMLRATSRRAVGPLPWPRAFGTPPWTAARQARFPGVRYGHRPVDDGDREAMARLLAWVRRSVERGVPVPLFTGGDPRGGLDTAVPRHVVLAVPWWDGARRRDGAPSAAGSLAIYEPTTGRVHVVPGEDLVARTRPHAALGGWTHVCWAVLPRAASREPRGGPGARLTS